MLPSDWFEKTHTIEEFWTWKSAEFFRDASGFVISFFFFVFLVFFEQLGVLRLALAIFPFFMAVGFAYNSWWYLRRTRTFQFQFRRDSFFVKESNFQVKRQVEIAYSDISPDIQVQIFNTVSSPKVFSLYIPMLKDFGFQLHFWRVPGRTDFLIDPNAMWFGPFEKSDAEQIRDEILHRRNEQIARNSSR